MIVFAVVDDALSPDFSNSTPSSSSMKCAATIGVVKLRIEERELERVGGLN